MPSEVLNKELIQSSAIDEYHKLFGIFSAKDSLSLLADNPLIKRANQTFSSWSGGDRANSLAIIGNEGCGCNIAAEQLLQSFGQDHETLTISLGRYAIVHDGLAGTLGERLGCGRSASMGDLLKVINQLLQIQELQRSRRLLSY